jgi:hypothetical protein
VPFCTLERILCVINSCIVTRVLCKYFSSVWASACCSAGLGKQGEVSSHVNSVISTVFQVGIKEGAWYGEIHCKESDDFDKLAVKTMCARSSPCGAIEYAESG